MADDPRSPLDDPRWRTALRSHASTPPDPEAFERITARHRRGRMVLAGAAALVVVAVAVGAFAVASRDDDESTELRTADSTTTTTTAPEGPILRATTTVLEDSTHGPELCLGGVLDSYPPQCGNVPVTNWDWGAVEGEERANQSIWGDYAVTGTYDGQAFTLTEAPGPPGTRPSDPGTEVDFTSPCPTPLGGWGVVDASKVSNEAANAVRAAASAEPDYAIHWVDTQGGTTVLNFAFTGDLERHEAELRAIWGGPMCVSRKPNAIRDLERIQQEITDDPTVQHLNSSGGGSLANVVLLTVVYDDGSLQTKLDERYGKGLVQVTSALQPAG